MQADRLVAAARGGWAVFLLICPDRPVQALTGVRLTVRDRRVLRVLGARELVQSAVGLVHPSRRVLGVGSAVDALHAASCLGLAAVDARWRRGGLLGAVDAAAFAVAGYAGARRGGLGVTASAGRR
ncbi:MAG: hypothetical protein J2P24_13155 [Streptosporangiales bacterium]|nr:hypothetical protein [Streptosporangiales bacterium]MBO0892150.1 hypothetical protein [Acidothermales bacterium]